MEMRMNRNLRKTAFGLLMAVALIAGTFTAEARDEDPVKIDDIWYVMDDSDMTAMVTSDFDEGPGGFQTSYLGDIVIPPYVEYNGNSYRVTSIGPLAFYWVHSNSLSIPETVVEIDTSAIFWMPELRVVEVDEANPIFISVDGVLYTHDMKVMLLFPMVWGYRPDHDERPSEFSIPEGVEEIDANLSNWSIQRYIFPDTLKKICSSAFWHGNITELELPESMEYLGNNCLSRLRNGFDLRIPDNVTYIGDYCFSESPFTSITLPKGITCIGEGWFQDCTGMKKMKLHEGITRICRMAFNRCTIDLELPESLVELDEYAFQGIETPELQLPDRLKELPDSLFLNSPIHKVSLGKGIERIGSIFMNCWNISDIYCPMESAPDIDSENPLGLDCQYEKLGKVNVHVRKGCAQAYLDSPWKLVGPIIEDLTDGVGEVGDDMTIHDDELCEAYSLSGATVASRLRFGEVSNALPKGLYIIRTASGKSAKIVVR